MVINSISFTYNHISSNDMKVKKINTSSGLLKETFMHSRSIREEKIRGNDRPYFIGIDREPLRIPLSIWFEDGLSNEIVSEIALWLNQDYYKPLVFSENPNRIYYAMYDGSMELLHNAISDGYVELEMKCDSPYSYSPILTSSIYDFSFNNVNGSSLTFINNGHVECHPIIIITKIGNGDITLINNTDGNKELRLVDIANNEIIKIDCENEEIESDIPGMLRYDNHNDVFFSFSKGINNLTVYGNCKIQFNYEKKFLVG